jgi:sugar phosphate isomerase/epimerase
MVDDRLDISGVVACSTTGYSGSLEHALKGIARLGFRHVDVVCNPSWDHVHPARLADDFDAVSDRVERLLARFGLAPIAGNAAFSNPHQRDAEANRQRVRHAEAVARLLNRLGVRVCSLYPGSLAEDRNWDDVLADTVLSLRELLDIGSRYDVEFAVEMHYRTPFQSLEQGRRLLDAVPGLRVAYDPTHFALQGIPVAATRWFLARAGHVHVRDATRERMYVPGGTGVVDMRALFSVLREENYQGNYAIECLPGPENEIEADIRRLRERMAQFGVR